MMRFPLFVSIVLVSASALAQNESRLARDFRVEGEALRKCGQFSLGSMMDCGQTLVMGQPVHIAVGNLAPQNGFGAGLAFVEHANLKNGWRLNWNADGIATPNGSWRVGGFMKSYRLSGGLPHPIYPGQGSAKAPKGPLFGSAPVLNLYSDTTSLNRVDFYGLGPNTAQTSQTTFGFRENITGVSTTVPLNGFLPQLRLALLGELNGRFPSVRSGSEKTIPSIEERFTEADAPGLTRQSAYFQPTEGIQLQPALFADTLRLNYRVQFQQFVSAGDSAYSFRRWKGDFSHEIPLYRLFYGSLGKAYSRGRDAGPSAHNGPDDCSASNPSNSALPCPRVSTTQNLEGAITLRFFLSESIAGAGSAVPFYFDPTIGGSDINSDSMLASYPDYRFRGPNLMLMRGKIEHSIGKLPIGAMFSVDEAKIGMRRDDISFDHLKQSFAAGLTVRAGGLPVFYLLFAWGGPEGHHTIANLSPTLLGGSSRPSLF
jgi:hypothetical protein